MIYALIIITFAVLSSLAGGSFKWYRVPEKYRQAPEVLIGVLFGLAFVWGFDKVAGLHGLAAVFAFLACAGWCFAWKETGHADALRWDDQSDTNPLRDNTLTPVALFLARIIGAERGKEGYSWLFIGLKGFLITLPFGGLGALFYPLGYEAGSHARGRVEKYGLDPHMFSELLSGAGLGVCVSVFIGVIQWI